MEKMDDIMVIHENELALWSDEKKKNFVDLFKRRAESSRYILLETARRILDRAQAKKYVSPKHHSQLFGSYKDGYIHTRRYGSGFAEPDRGYDELEEIAAARANEVLKGLPPIAKAVQVIDPETAKKIVRHEQLEKQGKELCDELKEMSGTIFSMEEHKDMLVGDFLAMVEKHNSRVEEIAKKLEKIGKEATKLDEEVCKRMYAGLPGISDAVIAAINSLLERAHGLDATTRRVEEHVLFGDSEAAMSVMKRFEQDEVEISEKVKSTFESALEILKNAVAQNASKKKTKAMLTGKQVIAKLQKPTGTK